MKEIKAPPLTPEQLAYFKEVGKRGGYNTHKTLTLLDIPDGSKIVVKEGTLTAHVNGIDSYFTADWLDMEADPVRIYKFPVSTPLKKHTRKAGHFVLVDKSNKSETREV